MAENTRFQNYFKFRQLDKQIQDTESAMARVALDLAVCRDAVTAA